MLQETTLPRFFVCLVVVLFLPEVKLLLALFTKYNVTWLFRGSTAGESHKSNTHSLSLIFKYTPTCEFYSPFSCQLYSPLYGKLYSPWFCLCVRKRKSMLPHSPWKGLEARGAEKKLPWMVIYTASTKEAKRTIHWCYGDVTWNLACQESTHKEIL